MRKFKKQFECTFFNLAHGLHSFAMLPDVGGHDTSRSGLGLVYWWHRTSKRNSAFSTAIQKPFGFQWTSVSIQ